VLTLLSLVPVTALTLLLSLTVLKYLWSDDSDRRDRAWMIAELLVRAGPARRRLQRVRQVGSSSDRPMSVRTTGRRTRTNASDTASKGARR
jgi:hypothetical protein